MPTDQLEPSHVTRLLRSVFDLGGAGLDDDFARRLLSFDFSDRDYRRIEKLNSKANEGTLSSEERIELEACVNVADMLAYWQSQARQHLSRDGGSGDK